MEEAKRKAKANWKLPLRGEEGGMSLSRRRLTPGNSEKAEKKAERASGFLEQTGAARGSRDIAQCYVGTVVTGRAAVKNRCTATSSSAAERERGARGQRRGRLNRFQMRNRGASV